MAVKGIGVIQNIGWEGADSFRIDLSCVGLMTEPVVDAGFSMSVSASISEAAMKAQIEEAIKDYLVANGIIFNPQDSVRLV